MEAIALEHIEPDFQKGYSVVAKSDTYEPLFATELTGAKKTVRGTSVLELYRAYSIGNLIAITGSGTTTILNYPAWRDIILSFMQKALLQIKGKVNARKRKALEDLRQRLNNVANDGLAMAALSIAQEILGREHGFSRKEMREIVAELFQAQRLWKHAEPRIYPADYFPKNGDPPSDLVIVDAKDIPLWVKFRAAGDKAEKLGAPRPTIDLPMELIRNWGIRRNASIPLRQNFI